MRAVSQGIRINCSLPSPTQTPMMKTFHETSGKDIVDAAAELPVKPNPYLSRGADLVAYSGGKILRWPQSAGVLLGRKDLIKAAWTRFPDLTSQFNLTVSGFITLKIRLLSGVAASRISFPIISGIPFPPKPLMLFDPVILMPSPNCNVLFGEKL